MQTVLTRLRRLHEEVCHCWRKQSEPHISEGDADVINLGLMYLEHMILGSSGIVEDKVSWRDKRNKLMDSYLNRVHAQFAYNSEIKSKGDVPSE